MVPGEVSTDVGGVNAIVAETPLAEDEKGSKRRQPEGTDGTQDAGHSKRKKVKGGLA